MNTATDFHTLINNCDWYNALLFLNSPENNHLFSESQFKTNNLNLMHALGSQYKLEGRLELAVKMYESMLAVDPNCKAAYIELGLSLYNNCQFDESHAAYTKAKQIDSKDPNIYNGLALVNQGMGNYESARKLFQKAIKISPSHAHAKFNFGLWHLLHGHYKVGFELYENRFKSKKYALEDEHFIKYLWRGESLQGKSIMMVSEQGFGDSMLFFRFAAQIRAQADTLYICCRKTLQSLYKTNIKADKFYAPDEPFPDYDYHIPFMSLGHTLELKTDTIPSESYITADITKITKWREKMPQNDKKKIGIVWGGGTEFDKSKIRNCPIELIEKLVERTRCDFFSLQVDSKDPQLNHHEHFHDYTSELSDFSETAGLIENLDLVITVDTAVAHLAGAMGKPVWILLYIPPAWQWGIEGENSIWYPSAKLFRQKRRGEWSGVIESVISELANFSKM